MLCHGLCLDILYHNITLEGNDVGEYSKFSRGCIELKGETTSIMTGIQNESNEIMNH